MRRLTESTGQCLLVNLFLKSYLMKPSGRRFFPVLPVLSAGILFGLFRSLPIAYNRFFPQEPVIRNRKAVGFVPDLLNVPEGHPLFIQPSWKHLSGHKDLFLLFCNSNNRDGEIEVPERTPGR